MVTVPRARTRSRRSRPRPTAWAAAFGLTPLLVAAIAAGQAGAALPAGCSQAGTTVTCAFGSTGAEQTFTVPDGVGSVRVVAVGAPGGASGPRQPSPVPGGAGAVVTGTLPVTPGRTLYVVVGGPGDAGFYTSAGGFNGGGAGVARNTSGNAGGGGGGGASDVRTAPLSAGLSPDPRLLVAAGGGGAGAPTPIGGGLPGDYTGGPGGAAGQAGAAGRYTCLAPPSPGGGGRPGSATAGGAGGAGGTGGCEAGETTGRTGAAGVLGVGGGGGNLSAGGGGGGGGLFGGGQGGQGVFDPNDGLYDGAGGGGGGGSSLAPAGGSVAANTGGLGPSVTISYTVPGGGVGAAPAPRAGLKLRIGGPRQVAAGGTATYRVTVSRSHRGDQRAVPVRNVRIVSAGTAPWRVPLLLPGRDRTRTVHVRVPATARGRFCTVHTARSATAKGATARHCARVVGSRTSPGAPAGD